MGRCQMWTLNVFIPLLISNDAVDVGCRAWMDKVTNFRNHNCRNEHSGIYRQPTNCI